jgi:TatD DNase family protein
MEFIDTHTHLYLEQFDADRDEVVRKALDNQVRKMLLPNIDSDSIEPLWALCNQYPNQFFPMAGLHPTSVKEDYKEQLKIVAGELDERNYIAVGEIGIDLYWDKTFAREQKESLLFQFDLAVRHNLPVVIHSRESFREIMETIEEFNNPALKGVFHCFTGKQEEAVQIIDKGFYLGIGGVVTFKNSGLASELKGVALDHLMLETDAPYLTPTPYRGKRNESSYIPLIAQKLAEVYELPVDEIARTTTQNAKKLFNIE